MTATMLSATVLSPLLGGWRNVLILLGAPAVIIGLLWLFTGREPRKDERIDSSATSVPFRQALSQIIRIKEVWIMGFIQLCLWGTYTGTNGYIPMYLRNIGWTPAAADTAMTVLIGSLAVGMIPMMLLSNRLRADKATLIFSLIVLAISLVLLPFVQDRFVYPLLIVSSFLRSASTPLCSVLIFRIKGVGSTYAGSAMGLTSTLGMVGSFAAPPLGNSLAEISDGAPFIFWAALTTAALPLFLFINRDAASLPSSSRRSLPQPR
jgi:NNP family nitrate/nitrite transporter-like MFS transporter